VRSSSSAHALTPGPVLNGIRCFWDHLTEKMNLAESTFYFAAKQFILVDFPFAATTNFVLKKII
jgi:hypothetical protein